jgi:SAM-dependent methyltransferase
MSSSSWSREGHGAQETIMITTLIKRTPVVGPLAKRGARLIGLGKTLRSRTPANFERLSTDSSADACETSRRRLTNLLNYTKISGASYSARNYPAGYHSIEIDGVTLEGQRNPHVRLASVPIDFRGKTVLDIGSNQGGMLFALDGIEWGVGIDFDSRMVNAANRISAARRTNNLGFYVFDLDKEPLELIEDFFPSSKIDIVLLLSVCMWVKNWRQVIAFAARTADEMLFESNGAEFQQDEQEKELRRQYDRVDLLAESSDDDPRQKRRRLFYCSCPSRRPN